MLEGDPPEGGALLNPPIGRLLDCPTVQIAGIIEFLSRTKSRDLLDSFILILTCTPACILDLHRFVMSSK